MFFYGPLRSLPLLEVVLGRDVDPAHLRPAILTDHQMLQSTDGSYPVLRPDWHWEVQGECVDGLGADDRERLDFYAACFGLSAQVMPLTDGSVAEVFMPDGEHPAGDLPWMFEEWEPAMSAHSMAVANEVMYYFGQRDPSDVSRILPRVRARATSYMLAQNSRHGQGTLDGAVEILNFRRAYSEFFALDEITFRHERFDGTMSEPLRRGVFVNSDAAIILPYDPVRDRVLLVEQVRMGPIGRGDPVRWQLEPVAGLVDPGEDPEATARREGREEANVTFGEVIPVAESYASPGAATDFFHIFVGLCDLPDEKGGIHGLEQEGENIRVHLMAVDDLLTMADDRRLANVELGLLAYWLARHRSGLRGRPTA